MKEILRAASKAFQAFLVVIGISGAYVGLSWLNFAGYHLLLGIIISVIFMIVGTLLFYNAR